VADVTGALREQAAMATAIAAIPSRRTNVGRD
jgi:hypothetical protein